ncbi:MAG TPA: hypothetical protein VGP72_07565 [Planctomycetota bacterium]|jgi:hypothetical protein
MFSVRAIAVIATVSFSLFAAEEIGPFGPRVINPPADADTKADAPKTEERPRDKVAASGFAAAAAKLAQDGKFEKARDIAFKALIYDENCPQALYELGKIFERTGPRTAAADFLSRALREIRKDETGGPNYPSMRMDAERRLLTLNPYTQQLSAILTEYAQEMDAVYKKSPDSLIQSEVAERVQKLHMADYVAAEKLPKVGAVALAPSTPSKDTSAVVTSTSSGTMDVPPDVERALRQAGWTKITGKWTKKSENVYEVTDGKLEAAKTNGAIQVAVHRGGTGTVKAFVRNGFDAATSTSSSSTTTSKSNLGLTGYGMVFQGGKANLITPCQNYSSSYSYSVVPSNTGFKPLVEREIALVGALAKDVLLVSINEGACEIHLNGKKEKAFNYKVPKDGPFAIEVKGTATIEAPGAKGQ